MMWNDAVRQGSRSLAGSGFALGSVAMALTFGSQPVQAATPIAAVQAAR